MSFRSIPLALCLTLGCWGVGCDGQAKPASPQEVVLRFFNAVKDGDASKANDCLHPESALLKDNDWRDEGRRTAYIQKLSTTMRERRAQITILEVKLDGSTAVVSFRVRAQDDADQGKAAGLTLKQVLKEGAAQGDWRIVHPNREFYYLIPNKPEVTSSERNTHRSLKGHSAINWITYSPTGRWVASGSHSGTIEVWDVSTQTKLHTISGHSKHGNAIAFSHDERILAFGSPYPQNTLVLWETTRGRERSRLPRSTGPVKSVQFSPNGRHLAATGDHDSNIEIWDFVTESKLRTIQVEGNLRSIAYSPDGKFLGYTRDAEVVLLDSSSYELVARLNDGEKDPVEAFAFSSDARLIASTSKGSIKVWEVRNGWVIRKLTGHKWGPSSVAFRLDGKAIASGGDTVKLWEVPTGKELRTIAESRGTNWYVAFSPVSKQLAAGRDEIRIWDMTD